MADLRATRHDAPAGTRRGFTLVEVMLAGVLTAFLLGSGAGTVFGGMLADRYGGHDRIVAVGLTAAAFYLSGCGQQQEPAPQAGAVDPAGQEVLFWYTHSGPREAARVDGTSDTRFSHPRRRPRDHAEPHALVRAVDHASKHPRRRPRATSPVPRTLARTVAKLRGGIAAAAEPRT